MAFGEKLCLLSACSGNQKPNRAKAGETLFLGVGVDARLMLWDSFSEMWGNPMHHLFTGEGCGASVRPKECAGRLTLMEMCLCIVGVGLHTGAHVYLCLCLCIYAPIGIRLDALQLHGISL